jgi:hypothetical protein
MRLETSNETAGAKRDGAFVIDPNGHNIKAVCHDPQ